MLTAKEIKDFAEAQWQSKGVRNAANGNVFQEENGCVRIKAGATWNFTSKETKRRQKGLAMYNPKLREIILAEASREMRDQKVEKPRKAWEDPAFEVKPMPHYTWPKEQAPEAPKARRKRVSRKQAEQAAVILAKVPESELAAFLSRFGLSLTTCAALASIGDVEAMAREFLRAVA
jgi:hypothetical protein